MATVVEFDVVVVGAGAAGLAGALTAAKRGLRTVVIEKAAVFGGSAARSGAGIWVPNNEVILAAGVPDTPALASTYLSAVVGTEVPAARRIDPSAGEPPTAVAPPAATGESAAPSRMRRLRDSDG